MPIRSMFFSGAETGRDIHLIRGDVLHSTSRAIRDFGLAFSTTGSSLPPNVFATDYFDPRFNPANFDVVLQFLPTFRHNDDHVSAELENFGIHVNRASGSVRVDRGPIAKPFPSNFVIRITAEHPNVTPAPTAVLPLYIRVHVHDGVDRIWITPNPLTVRRRTPAGAEDTSYRFTVRARFTDGVVGDITLFHGVTWTPSAHFAPGPFTDRAAQERAGRIRLPAGFQGPATVTATWQAGGRTLTASAPINAVAPWASVPPASLPKIELVSGAPAVRSGASPERFPNILMFGAGFAAGTEMAVFEQTVAKVAAEWKADFMTRPFDVLADSMNIWRAASPALNPPVSVRGAVYRSVQTSLSPAGVLREAEYAAVLSQAIPHPGGAAKWSLKNLMFAVGLPLPSYPTELRTPELGFVTGVKAFWAATSLLNEPISLTDRPGDIPLIDQWLELASVHFIDEEDSFPAIAVGAPPDMEQGRRGAELSFHADRGDADELRAHFAALSSSDGITVTGGQIGHLWSGGQPNPAHLFDNAALVVTLIAGQGGAVRVPGRGIFVPLEPAFVWPIDAVPGSPGQVRQRRLDPLTVPTIKTFPEFSRVIAHELSHGLGLLDEYAEFPTSFTALETTLIGSPNVTSLEAVVNSGKVQSAMIKWNWDRIRHAAVLTGPVTEGGGAFKIPVVAGQELAFKQGETVRLRLRVPGRPLARAIDTLVTFADLNLTVVSLLGNAITVTSASAKISELGKELRKFTPGSIVYAPIRAVPANADSPFLKLIAPRVAAKIDTSGDPLTGPTASCDPNREASIGPGNQIPKLDALILPFLFSRRNTPYVVGLYTGGARFGCGIFHPTGACMMRDHHPDNGIFCTVCRYALVDLIDPTKHLEMDRDYEFIYPD